VQSLTSLEDSLSDNAIEQYVSRLRRRLPPHGVRCARRGASAIFLKSQVILHDRPIRCGAGCLLLWLCWRRRRWADRPDRHLARGAAHGAKRVGPGAGRLGPGHRRAGHVDEAGGLEVDIPYSSLEMLTSTAQDKVFYRVDGPVGTF
jgi:hypothetical protein